MMDDDSMGYCEKKIKLHLDQISIKNHSLHSKGNL
jgi:hypothetical protein